MQNQAPLKILLVDDRPSNLLALEHELRELPAEFVRATSGDEALGLTLRHRFALAILDVQMPSMDGYELAELLLGNPATSTLPIIFLSATYDDHAHRLRGYATGAVDDLVKPVDHAVLTGKVKVFLDIAKARRGAEHVAALRSAQHGELTRRFDAVVDAMQDGFWQVDAEGKIVGANPAYARLVGRDLGEIVGRNVNDFMISGSNPELVQRRLREIADHPGTLRFLTQHRHRDGHTVDLEASATHVPELDGHIAFLRDISEFNRLNRSVRALVAERNADARVLVEILESTADGFWRYDAHGQILAVNRGYAAMLGYRPDEMCGLHIWDISLLTPTPDAALEVIAGIARAGWQTLVTEHRHRDGHTVPVEVSATYLPGRDEVVGFIRDVRERHQREEAERALRDELVVASRSFATLFETSSDGMGTVDREGRYTSVNDAMCRMLGRAPEELLGRLVADSSSGADTPESVSVELQRLVDSAHTDRFEKTLRHASGRVVQIEMASTYLPERGEHVFIGRDVTERNRAAKRLSDIINISRDGFWIVTADGRIATVNPAYCAMVGYDADEIVGRLVSDISLRGLQPEDVARTLRAVREGGGHASLTTSHRHRDGRSITLSVSAMYLAEHDEYAVFLRDVTEKRRAEAAEAALRAEREVQARRFDAILRHSLDGYLAVDRAGVVVDANDAYASLVGWPLDEIRGAPVARFLGVDYLAEAKMIIPAIFASGSARVDAVHRHRDGSLIEVEASAWHAQDDGLILVFVRDVRERKRHEAEARMAAFHDALTGLPNRRMLIDRYRRAVATSARKKQHGALMYLDLDHFKLLNDTLGHEVGDGFLREVARRLLACVRPGDTVARLGGDEFVVVLEDLAVGASEAAGQAGVIAERIRAALAQSYLVGDYVHRGSSSIGVVLFEAPRDDLDTVLARADSAMYQAKRGGRDGVHFFDAGLQSRLAERAALDREMRAALAAEQFELFYQVQVDAAERACGAEALIRWRHPERGLVMPGAFIAAAEESGFIRLLGAWVLRAACRQLVAWQASPHTRAMRLSVNVSAKQFAQFDFVAHVQDVLDETGAPPSLLRLELTESTALRDVERTVETMRALKGLGVRFSMDDFGSGYSSLTYLRRLPFDELKIDQSFVRGLGQDGVGVAIVRSIVAMSEALGIDVVAEGVETADERAALAAHGCGTYQGYLFGRPIPARDFEAALAAVEAG